MNFFVNTQKSEILVWDWGCFFFALFNWKLYYFSRCLYLNLIRRFARQSGWKRDGRHGFVCSFGFRWWNFSVKSQTQQDKKMRHVNFVTALSFLSFNSSNVDASTPILELRPWPVALWDIPLEGTHTVTQLTPTNNDWHQVFEVKQDGLTRPAMGVGSLLIFFTRAGLMELSNLWRNSRHEA